MDLGRFNFMFLQKRLENLLDALLGVKGDDVRQMVIDKDSPDDIQIVLRCFQPFFSEFFHTEPFQRR